MQILCGMIRRVFELIATAHNAITDLKCVSFLPICRCDGGVGVWIGRRVQVILFVVCYQ
jgi:hypothetical protein